MNPGSGNGFKAFLAFFGLMAFFGLSLGDVVVNEVELSPPDNGTVWVELYNTGESAVDLTSWTVKIEDGPWVGPIALVGSIESKGFLAVDGQQSWVTTGNGTVYLLDSSGNEVDKTSQQSDDSQSDFTYGRIPDGKKTDTKADFAFMMGSKGRSNGRGVMV
jgi:Lamin Tail Domain